MIRTVTNCGIWVNVDFRLDNPEWVCSVELMIQVSQDPIITKKHQNMDVYVENATSKIVCKLFVCINIRQTAPS